MEEIQINILIKAYAALNLGDDLFIHMLCSKFKEHTFTLYSKFDYKDTFNYISNLNVIDNCNSYSEEELTNLYKFDYIVYIGGSIFKEYNKNAIKAIDKLIYMADRTKMSIIGCNFGPYKTQEYFDKVKNEVIPKLDKIIFRDKYSYELFRSFSNVEYASDIVFSLDLNDFNIDVRKKSKEIGISLIHHLERENLKPYYNLYLNKVKDVIKLYTLKGYRVNLFSFCEIEKDMQAIKDVKNLLEDEIINNVTVYNYTGNIKEYLQIMNRQECLVTSRFHSLVLGLILGNKVSVISYSDKINNIIKDFNLDVYKVDFKDINKFELDSIEKSNLVNVDKIKLDANKHFDILNENLKLNNK